MLVHLHRSMFILFGLLSLACGVLGIFLPLLPTTPFLLLSAWCFARGSERLHAWLLNHKWFGGIIRDWEENGVIRTKMKWLATVSMCLLVSYPLIFMLEGIWLRAVVMTSILCVLLFIWTRPSGEVSDLA